MVLYRNIIYNMNKSRKIKRTRKQTNNKTKKRKYGGMKKDAKLSDDKLYRYQLSRIWDEDKPKVLFIMLNPSTADADVDDPTIRRVINFAKSWNYGGVFVVNLYAFRSTDPKGLKTTSDPIGPENRKHIQELVGSVDRVIYAWGNKEKEPQWLRELITTPYCIALSTKGIPKHPLYLKGDSQPILYLRDACQGQAAAAGAVVEGE
jgi:hypothetical protein